MAGGQSRTFLLPGREQWPSVLILVPLGVQVPPAPQATISQHLGYDSSVSMSIFILFYYWGYH